MYRKNSFSDSEVPLDRVLDENDNSFVKYTEDQTQKTDMTFWESFWLACKRSTPTILTMIFF